MKTFIVYGMHGTREWLVRGFLDDKKADKFASDCDLMSEALCVIAQEYKQEQEVFEKRFPELDDIHRFGINKYFEELNRLRQEYEKKILELSATNTLDNKAPLVVYNSPFSYGVTEVEVVE